MFGDHRVGVPVFRCSTALLLGTIAVLLSAPPVAAQSALRAVGVSTVGGEAVVTVEATGPLPSPTLGALDGPPRIFLDFANVRLAAQGLMRTSDPRIRRVRVGTFSVDPLVTRVVIDLTVILPHRIEVATGRVMVFIGASSSPMASTAPPAVREPPPAVRPVVAPPEATPPPKPTSTTSGTPSTKPSAVPTPKPEGPPPSTLIPPVPPLPPESSATSTARTSPRVPSTTETAGAGRPYRAPTPPPPSKDIEKYRAQAGTLLERLKLQMPLLELMRDVQEDVGPRMPAALQEFDRLREELEAIKPPETLRTQHDLLLQAARLGSTAARLRLEAVYSNDAGVRRNGASAAAGASLLLDRAFAEVGFVPDGR